MNNPANRHGEWQEKPLSWRGLFMAMTVGAGLVGLLLFGVFHVWQKNALTERRLHDEWLDPYLQTLRDGQPDRAWNSLTTDSLRSRYSLNEFVARSATVRSLRGRPTAVEIIKVISTTELAEGRAFMRVVTRWQWERGADFNRTLELVDEPDAGFRLDRSTLGGRDGNLPLDDLPADGW